MHVTTSTHVDNKTEFSIHKLWDSQDISDPNADLTIRFDYLTTIHIQTADLERLFGVINAHLEQVHKARKAEVEAERYAQAMHDEYISASDLFDQDDLIIP